MALPPGQFGFVQFALEPGFRFKNVENEVSYIWRLAITTDTGFTPQWVHLTRVSSA